MTGVVIIAAAVLALNGAPAPFHASASHPAAAPAPLSFKEVAAQGGAIVMARCITAGRESIACWPIEAWRGTAPKKSIVIARDEWGPFRVEAREAHPEGKFLLIVQPKREVGCVIASPKSGGTLRRVGNVDTCVVPIVAGHLPKEFRRWYDHTDGPSLTIDQLKTALLNPSRSAYIDNAYGATLFGDTVDDVLCFFGDSIAGPMKRCPVAGYEAMFETMTTHSGEPGLGLGPGHTVQELPL